MIPFTGIRSIGLTGGIGAGKSTAAQILARHGAYLIDADQISRQLTATAGAALPAIATVFGPEMIGPDGAMDRAKMRNLVFSDPEAKQALEAIVHPLIYQETDRQRDWAMQRQVRCVVFDLPLLVESPRWRNRLDHVLVIDCKPEAQITRVEKRNQLNRAQIQAIMAHQAPRLLRLQAADSVIDNTHASLLELEQNIVLFLNFVAPTIETRNTGVVSIGG